MNQMTKDRIRTNIVMDPEMHRKVRVDAAEEHGDMSTIIDRALREYYERKNGSKKTAQR